MATTLGTVIKEARKSRGKTLRAFAKELDVSASLLSLIEQNRHIPTQELIVAAAKCLGGDPDKWCGLAGTLTPNAQKSLADMALDDPEFFRSMVTRLRGPNDLTT